MIRSLKFIGKFFAFVFLVSYVYVGLEASFMLVKKEINARQEITALPALIRRAADAPENVTAWVRLRPLAETAALVKILAPASAGLEPGIFFEIGRRRIQLGQTEDALFWTQLGRYRLRYDALRCGGEASVQALNQILNAFISPDIAALLEKRPELVKKSVLQVLDFDKKYPARNNPSATCKIVSALERNAVAPAPQEQWENIRRSLRTVTEFALKDMDGKKSR